MRSKPIRPHSTHPSFHTSLFLFIYSFYLSLSLLSLSLFRLGSLFASHDEERDGLDSKMGECKQACHGEIKRPSRASVNKLFPEPVSQSNGQSSTWVPIGRPAVLPEASVPATESSTQKPSLLSLSLSLPLSLCLSLSSLSLNVYLASVSCSEGPGGRGR